MIWKIMSALFAVHADVGTVLVVVLKIDYSAYKINLSGSDVLGAVFLELLDGDDIQLPCRHKTGTYEQGSKQYD